MYIISNICLYNVYICNTHTHTHTHTHIYVYIYIYIHIYIHRCAELIATNTTTCEVST